MARRGTPSVDDILMAIPNLTNDELSRIRSACSFSGASEPCVKEANEDENFLLFYDILSEVLLETTATKLPKQPSYLPVASRSKLIKGWTAADVFSKRVMRKRIGPARLTMLYRVIIVITIEHIHKIGIPVKIKTIAEQLENCGALMDQQFPGYLTSGMMSLIVKWGRIGSEQDEEDI